MNSRRIRVDDSTMIRCCCSIPLVQCSNTTTRTCCASLAGPRSSRGYWLRRRRQSAADVVDVAMTADGVVAWHIQTMLTSVAGRGRRPAHKSTRSSSLSCLIEYCDWCMRSPSYRLFFDHLSAFLIDCDIFDRLANDDDDDDNKLRESAHIALAST